MGRSIIKLPCDGQDYYLEYSSIVDAPVTYGLTLEELQEHIKDRYGLNGLQELPRRLERVDQFGSSAYGDKSVDEAIRGNRAGKNETCLTKEQIIEFYIRRPLKEEYPTKDQLPEGTNEIEEAENGG